MADEKIVNDKGKDLDKQRDYIYFLELILKICIILKDKIGTKVKNKTIFFRVKGQNKGWYGIQEEGWSNSLLCCVYDAVMSGTKVLEISQSENAASGEPIEIEAAFNFIPDKMSAEENENSAEVKINEILSRLQSGFIDNGAIGRLRRDSNAFFPQETSYRRKSLFFI